MAPPTKLKKPYLFSLPIADLEKWIKDMKSALKSIEAANEVQHTLLNVKTTSKGKRVTVWALGFRPGYCGDSRGVTKEQWDALCAELTANIVLVFPGAKPYKEPWKKNRKFQYNFETYVQYAELVVP